MMSCVGLQTKRKSFSCTSGVQMDTTRHCEKPFVPEENLQDISEEIYNQGFSALTNQNDWSN